MANISQQGLQIALKNSHLTRQSWGLVNLKWHIKKEIAQLRSNKCENFQKLNLNFQNSKFRACVKVKYLPFTSW